MEKKTSVIVDDVLIHNSILAESILDLKAKLVAFPLSSAEAQSDGKSNVDLAAVKSLIEEQIKGLEDLQNIVESQRRSIEVGPPLWAYFFLLAPTLFFRRNPTLDGGESTPLGVLRRSSEISISFT